MVYLILSKKGLSEVLRINQGSSVAMWLAHALLSEKEVSALLDAGHNVTVWQYPESTNNEELSGTIATIEEHHPGETVWVEYTSTNSH